ncbi:MAG: thymidine phosphorylase [candidate division Zixibacteria bacterium]|nr:thymidine phosphorylase [candidate division Zixibacteria bacterium]
MHIYEIIGKKRDKERLTQKEIEYFISGYTQGQIPDYQASALLMAIFLNGMDEHETFHLTQAMMNSGRVVDLKSIQGIKVDKHSTGGVGDKVSLILAPLVASCGVKVPMISGRGLGHTGGTLDKLESIPGFRTDLTLRRFVTNLRDLGVCMIGQTAEIAPADKKLYALRDVTATVNSVPLIASSIMSKKLAEGADAFVFDVKVGNGAFMQKRSDAVLLAKTLIRIAKRFKKRAMALITDMNEPLGETVGNSIEVIEAIHALKGKAPKDLMGVTMALGARMLVLGKKAKNPREAEAKLSEAIRTGKALSKFQQMVKVQGGNPKVVDDFGLLPWARFRLLISSRREGYVHSVDTRKIGLCGVTLGAGREKLDSPIDPSVGMLIKKKVGDSVKRNEPLAVVFANSLKKARLACQEIRQAYGIKKARSRRLKKVLLVVDEKGPRKPKSDF